MKKRIFLATMAAVTLSLGFTACSDEDENENSFNDEFVISFDCETEDTVEMNYVIQAYEKATGRSDIENNNTFAVSGKDSADCTEQFLAIMQKAEALLEGKQYDSNPIVYAMNRNNFPVYQKGYGTISNGLHAYVFKLDEIDEYTTKMAGALFIGTQLELCSVLTADMPRTININLFSGKHQLGDELILYVKRMGPDLQRRDNGYYNCITDVIVWDQDESADKEFKKQITYDGRIYQPAESCEMGEDYMDLNWGYKGHRLYLYYSYTLQPVRGLLIRDMAICYRYKTTLGFVTDTYTSTPDDFKGMIPESTDKLTVQFAPRVATTEDGTVVLKDKNCDLNEGIKSDWFRKPMHQYLLCVYTSDLSD